MKLGFNSGFYRIDLFCKNCGLKSNVEIPCGTTVWDFCDDYECPECGCKTVGRDMSKIKSAD